MHVKSLSTALADATWGNGEVTLLGDTCVFSFQFSLSDCKG